VSIVLIQSSMYRGDWKNGSGQNGMDKMVLDKMVWTKWYNFIFCVHFNSVEFNIYL